LQFSVILDYKREIDSPIRFEAVPNRQSLQAFAHHSTHSTLEASTFHSLHTRFAQKLIAGASIEQNSIGHTQIIITILVRTSNEYLKG
jgi:hypothetical protein